MDERIQSIVNSLRNKVLPLIYEKAPWEVRHSNIMSLFTTGDEFDQNRLIEEDEFLSVLFSGAHPPLISDAAKSRRGYLRTILEEAMKQNPSLVKSELVRETVYTTDLIRLSHLVRMESSRYEMENDVLSAVQSEIDRLEEMNLQLHFFLPHYENHRRIVSACLSPKTDEKSDYVEGCGFFTEEFSSQLFEQILIWREIKSVYERNVEETNSGLHLIDTDLIKKLRPGAGMEVDIFRYLQNLTKIWILLVDPNLSLPSRDNGAENCYSRAMMAALEYFGVRHIRSEQVIDRAYRVFRPRLLAEYMESGEGGKIKKNLGRLDERP